MKGERRSLLAGVPFEDLLPSGRRAGPDVDHTARQPYPERIGVEDLVALGGLSHLPDRVWPFGPAGQDSAEPGGLVAGLEGCIAADLLRPTPDIDQTAALLVHVARP